MFTCKISSSSVNYSHFNDMFTMDSFKIKGIFRHIAIFRRQTQLFPWFCVRGVQYYPWSYGLWFSVIKNNESDPISIEYGVYKVVNHKKLESSGETSSEEDDDISKIQERVVNEVFAETFPHLSERGVKEFANLSDKYYDDKPDPKTLKDIVVSDINSDDSSDELCPKTWSQSVNGIVGNKDGENSDDELRSKSQEQDVSAVPGENKSSEVYLKSHTQNADELFRNNVEVGLKPQDVIKVVGNNNSESHGDEFYLGSEYQDLKEVYHNSEELFLKSQEQVVAELLGINNSDELRLESKEQGVDEILGDSTSDELYLKSQEQDVAVLEYKNNDALHLKPQDVTEVSGNNNSDSRGHGLRLKSEERDVKEVLRINNSDDRGDECRLKSQEWYVNEVSGNNNSDGRGDECRLGSQEWGVHEISGNNTSDSLNDECRLKAQERDVDDVLGDINGNALYLKPHGVNEVLEDNKSDELYFKSMEQEVLRNNDSDEIYLKLQEQVLNEGLGDNKGNGRSNKLGINVSMEVGNVLVWPSKTTTVVLSDNNADFHDELDPTLQEQTVNEVLSVHSFNEGDEQTLNEVSGNTSGEYDHEFDPKLQNRTISNYDDMFYIRTQDGYMNRMLNGNGEFGPKSQKGNSNDVDSEHSSIYNQENCLELSERVVTEAASNDNSACSGSGDDTVPYSLERFLSGDGNVKCNGYGDNMVPFVSEVASVSGYHKKRDCNLSDRACSDSAYSSDPKIPEQCGDEANSNSYEYDPISLKRVVTGCEGKISKRSANKLITVTKIYYFPSVSNSDLSKVVGSSDKRGVKRTLARTHSTSLPSKLSEHCRSFADVMNVTLPVKHSSKDVSDDTSISEELSPVALPSQSPLSKSASPSPVVNTRKTSGGSVSSGDWPPGPEEDLLVTIHQSRPSLSSLGPRSDSLASVYSGAGEGRYGTVEVRGEVEFGLQYNYKAGALEILVKQCKDLAPVDLKRNRSDPYVKVYLLPDKSKSGKRKTKVKKHTLNPVFDETLKFHMTLHGLETRTLWLTVWHSDMFGRNDFLGEVMMPLENKVFDDPTPQWYPLQERTEPFDDLLSYKGDIIIGLKFVPPDVTVQKKGKRSRGSLHVLVKEAKNLIAVKANGTSDPFCKSYLLPDKGRSSKQKTPVLRRNCNPVWNCTFVYEDVSLQELSERSLELTVWDHDRLASNEFLGGLRFNLGTGKHYGKGVDWMDATGKEVTLWQSMLERPNFWVEGCLTLRPSLEQHRTS